MNAGEAVEMIKQALYLALMLSAPMLVLGLVAGLLVSIFQAVTQIHEMTLTFIPKIIAVVAGLVLFLPWMINQMVAYTTQLYLNAATLH